MTKPVRKKMRLTGYSYSIPGCYFITICSAGRRPVFGRIIPGSMLERPKVLLSDIGCAVNSNVQRISLVYPQVVVEKYVIMPNHVHLLLKVHDGVIDPDECRDKMLISKCIQSFKASVSRQTPQNQHPVWQSGFYDHIVRNEADYLRIWKYIDDNPAKWTDDCYYVT